MKSNFHTGYIVGDIVVVEVYAMVGNSIFEVLVTTPEKSYISLFWQKGVAK